MNKDTKIILLATSLLIMIGVVMMYSSSAVYAFNRYGDSLYFAKRHLLFLVAGVILSGYFMAVPLNKISSNAKNIFLACVLLLVAVLVPGIGTEVNGARRWIRFLGMGFQPSEIAKIALIIYLADFSSRKRYLMGNLWHGFAPPLFLTGFVAGLIFIEPDMGTSVSILFIGLVMLFVAGTKIKHLISMVLVAVPVLIAGIIMEPYRMRRILTFFNPWKDARGAGFQLVQSFIALGSGGFLGVGLGQSKQKLFYLPEAHTDFIFSIIGEELGFVGTSAVLILFIILIWFALRVSFKIKNIFASRVVLGICVMIAFEVIVNIGVSTGAFRQKDYRFRL